MLNDFQNFFTIRLSGVGLSAVKFLGTQRTATRCKLKEPDAGNFTWSTWELFDQALRGAKNFSTRFFFTTSYACAVIP